VESQRVLPENPIAVLVALGRARASSHTRGVFPRILHDYVADSANLRAHRRYEKFFSIDLRLRIDQEVSLAKRSALQSRPLKINGSHAN
jgi:hypothetical protein